MNVNEFKLQVRTKLLQIPSTEEIYSDTDQIKMRCQFCGDSRKDPNKKRLYIKLNIVDDSLPVLYNCFNCGASGVLTPSVLRTFNINDLRLNSSLVSFNKKSISNFNKRFGLSDNDFKFVVPRPKNTKSNAMKKKYIEDRLGITVSASELVALKTIFSLEQFLKENGIENVNTKPGVANMLNNEYIGFLTAKNEFINFRDTSNKNKMRYYKYPIFSNIDNTRKFYTIPTKVDLMSNEPININLAEGVFDILGVYYHIYNKNTTHNVYVAVCGSAYVTVVKYFIQRGIFGNNVIINIFSDIDHPPYFYKRLVDELSTWVSEIRLYYNNRFKDFGTSKDNIDIFNKAIPVKK